MLGTAGLPHILIRFYTTPTAKAARKSVLWAIGLIGGFYLMTLVLGFGAAALVDTGKGSQIADIVGQRGLAAAGPGGGRRRGHPRRVGAAGADLGGGLRHHPGRGRRADPDLGLLGGPRPLRQRDQEGQGQREAASWSWSGSPRSCIGAVAIALAIPAQRLNIAFLVALAFAVAASANLPALLFNLFWRRFNTAGATFSIYGGLIAAVVW